MIDTLLRNRLITETQGDHRRAVGALLIQDSTTDLILTSLVLADAGFGALNLDPPDSAPAANTGAADPRLQASQTRSPSASLLRGLLVRADGSAMSPSHFRKKGKTYRYYTSHPYDPAIYRCRRLIENLFAKLKDWRRIATPYDRCADIVFGAIVIAATVIFWLK